MSDSPPDTLIKTTPRVAIDRTIRERAKALYFQGLPTGAIAAELGLSKGTVTLWTQRYGWSKLRAETKAMLISSNRRLPARVAVAGITGSEQSQRVRSVLGDVIERQAVALASKEPKLSDLPNTPSGQGHVSVLKTLAEAASTVFDWESQRTPGIVVIGEIESAEPEPEPAAIDIPSETAQLADAEPETKAGN